MEQQEKVVNFNDVLDSIRKSSEVYRFEIFKGTLGEGGKVYKIKPVGAAYLRSGMKTYTVRLKTFLKDNFYLLPNSKAGSGADFVILTREPAQHSGRKYFWNNVGEGTILDGVNREIMRLNWDVLGDDLYMNLHPATVNNTTEAMKADAS